MLARQRQAVILEEVRRTGAVRVSDLVVRLGVSDMTVRRDLDVLAARGLVEKVYGGATSVVGRSHRRARFRGQVGAAAAREGGDRRAGGRTRASRYRDRPVGGHDDVDVSQVPGRHPGPDRRDELDPRRGRAAAERTHRPHGRADRRRAHAVRRAGRPGGGAGVAVAAPGRGVPRRARHGRALRLHHARTSTRARPTARSSTPPGAWSWSPTTRSGAPSAFPRSPTSTRRTCS